MLRPFLLAGSVALALIVSPAIAQQTPTPDQPSAQQVDPKLVGLPIYSSDGQKLGEVAEVGLSAGQPAVRAEMGEFLGLGAASVIIDATLFEKKTDRIEVAMTAEVIKDTVSKQREERKQEQQ
jgi:PRC-barrel domain